MAKRQSHAPQEEEESLSDEELNELVEQDENPNLFEHLYEDFQEMMKNKQVLKGCVESFFDNAVDEATLGIIFDVHRKFKTNAYCLEVHQLGEEDETSKNEAFQQASVKNCQKFNCPNCERTVAPLNFARHLAKCMGIRSDSRSSRTATRRAVTIKDKEDTSSYGNFASDDDDDEDWSTRKSTKKKDKNGGKKGRGTPKKNVELQEYADATNVDIEGSYDEVTNLRYMMDNGRRSFGFDLQDSRSNSSSPTDGTGSYTPSKKRDKAKKKNKGKGSPSTSLSFD
ncbi:SAGA-associated factor 11 homolog [Dendroctonus ponderosae]